MAKWRLIQKKKEMEEAVYNSQILYSSAKSSFQDEESSQPSIANYKYEVSPEQNLEKPAPHSSFKVEMHDHHSAYMAEMYDHRARCIEHYESSPVMQDVRHSHSTERSSRFHIGEHRYRNEYNERPIHRDEMHYNYGPAEFHNHYHPSRYPDRIYEEGFQSEDGRGVHVYGPGVPNSNSSPDYQDYRFNCKLFVLQLQQNMMSFVSNSKYISVQQEALMTPINGKHTYDRHDEGRLSEHSIRHSRSSNFDFNIPFFTYELKTIPLVTKNLKYCFNTSQCSLSQLSTGIYQNLFHNNKARIVADLPPKLPTVIN